MIFRRQTEFLRKKDCISNNRKKVGIEHASAEAIISALNNVYTPTFNEDVITMNELFELGFISNLLSYLPLYNQGFGWVLICLVMFIVGLVIPKLQAKK